MTWTINVPAASGSSIIPGQMYGLESNKAGANLILVDAGTCVDATGLIDMGTSGSLGIDAADTGALGIDTGALANDTWYFTWRINKADGTQSALVSLSATAPTMPSGYTIKRLVGACRYGTGAFINFQITGKGADKRCMWGNNSVDRRVLSNGKQITTYADIDLSAWVPSISEEPLITAINEDSVDFCRLRPDLSSEANGTLTIYTDASHDGMICPSVGQVIEYVFTATPSTGLTVNVFGYLLQL